MRLDEWEAKKMGYVLMPSRSVTRPRQPQELSFARGAAVFSEWADMLPSTVLHNANMKSRRLLIQGEARHLHNQPHPARWFLFMLDGVATGALPPLPQDEAYTMDWRKMMQALGLKQTELALILGRDPVTIRRQPDQSVRMVGLLLLIAQGHTMRPELIEWSK